MRLLGWHVIIVSESKFKSSAFFVRLFSLTPFITCDAIIKFDAVLKYAATGAMNMKENMLSASRREQRKCDFTLFLHLSDLTFRTGPKKF